MIHAGDTAPDFSLQDQDGVTHTLSQYLGKKILLYFYPKDDTPGCTTEACTIRDSFDSFKSMDMVVLGVSLDNVQSHKKFATKYELPFPLLADVERKVSEAYGVYGLKKFMGREYMGLARTSFLIDESGVISKIYEKVKPAEHASEVLTDAG